MLSLYIINISFPDGMLTRTFLALLLLIFSSEPAAAAEANLRLVFYSGNPEILSSSAKGGIPALATLLKNERGGDKPTFFLHGGRAIAPSTLSAFDRGTHMIDLLNLLQPDAFSVGKSEFAFNEDELTLRTREASFPFLSANLFDPLTKGPPEGIVPHTEFQTNGFNIALFSITNPELIEDYTVDRVSILDADSTIRRTSKLLRKNGADIVIMMTDFHIPESRALFESDIVDIILITEKEDGAQEHSGGLLVVHGRGDNTVLVDLALKRDDSHLTWQYEYSFTPLKPVSQDPAVKDAVGSYIQQLDKFLAAEIGVTRTRLDTRKKNIRTSENAFGNLTADALRSFFNTDIGLMNGGGIRGDRVYQPGTVLTRGDMLREIPFRNHAVQIEVTGRQLLEALENGLSRIEDQKGRFPHVSGIRVFYNPDSAPLHRVRSVMVGDRKLNLEDTYSLATVNFLANGGDGYNVFKDCRQLDTFGSSRLLWEYVKDYITDQQQISPKIEGRLKTVSW